jgi:hypothetical protein
MPETEAQSPVRQTVTIKKRKAGVRRVMFGNPAQENMPRASVPRNSELLR